MACVALIVDTFVDFDFKSHIFFHYSHKLKWNGVKRRGIDHELLSNKGDDATTTTTHAFGVTKKILNVIP